MSKNLFEVALEKKETEKFFMGENGYFLLNREDGTHSYLMQTSSVGRDYVKSGAGHGDVFFDKVSLFLQKYARDENNTAAVWQTVLAIAKLVNNDIISLDFINIFQDGKLKTILQEMERYGQLSELGKGYLQILKNRYPVLYKFITE